MDKTPEEDLGIFNFNRKTYSVRYTGKIIHKKAKTFDYDGQDIFRPSSSRKQMGLYLEDVLCFIINERG